MSVILSALIAASLAPAAAMQAGFEAPIVAPVTALPVTLVAPLQLPSLQLLPLLDISPRLALEPLAYTLAPAPLTPALTPAAPFAAPAARLNGLAAASAPEFAAIAAPSASPASLRESGARLMEPLSAVSASGPSDEAPGASFKGRSGGGAGGSGNGGNGGRRRGKPLLTAVSFATGISVKHQDLLWETLSRRKAAWARGLAEQGVRLDGPVAPVFTVREARDLNPAGGAPARYSDFSIEWSQGEMSVGAFRAVVRLKDLQTTLRKLPAPQPPEDKQLTIRFRKTYYAEGNPIPVTVTPQEIESFLARRGLRVLRKDWEGTYTVSVTGQDEAAAVGRELTGDGLVYFASPLKRAVPVEDQLTVVFKQWAVIDAGIMTEISVDEQWISGFLRRERLSVISVTRDGVWRLASPAGVSAAKALARLDEDNLVLYAFAGAPSFPEARQAVIHFRESRIMAWGGTHIERDVTDDDKARLFARGRLTVLADLGSGFYRVGFPEGGSAAALSAEPALERAAALGSITEARVHAAVRGALSYKTSTYGASEYDRAFYEGRLALEREGADAAQLALYAKLCAEAPIGGSGRFNSWTGD